MSETEFTVKVGSRTAKLVNAAAGELRWEARVIREVSNHLKEDGTIEESTHSYVPLFSTGPLSSEVEEFLTDLKARYKELTPANYERFIGEIVAKTDEIRAKAPVTDKRKSREQLEQDLKVRRQRQAEELEGQRIADNNKKRFNPANRLVIIEQCYDNSDGMSDYYDPCAIEKRFVLCEVRQGRRDLRILHEIIQRYPSLAKLKWIEHKDSYSMNHWGYSLESETVPELGTRTNYGKYKVGFFYKVDFGEVSWHGGADLWPEKSVTPEPGMASNSEVQIRRNERLNGIEVVFPSKPSDNIITALKQRGFRWSPFNRLWYTRYDPITMQSIQSALNGVVNY